MNDVGNYIMPVIFCGIIGYGCFAGLNVFSVFVSGAGKGLETAAKILPSLVALATAVGMLRVSGALDVICYGLSPVATALGLPSQLIPLALLRPVSGSSAMVIFQNVLDTYHPDSYIGRVASVMMGSTETTFYTIALYFGATRVRDTRYSLSASLTADVVGFLMSVVAVGLFLGGA